MLVFVYMFFKRKNTRASSFYRCFTILGLRKCGFLYTRFLTFMLISTMVFYEVEKKQGEAQRAEQ